MAASSEFSCMKSRAAFDQKGILEGLDYERTFLPPSLLCQLLRGTQLLPPPSLGSLLPFPSREILGSSFLSFLSTLPILQSQNQRPRPSRSLLLTMLMLTPTDQQEKQAKRLTDSVPSLSASYQHHLFKKN